jgi:hypothetical protein
MLQSGYELREEMAVPWLRQLLSSSLDTIPGHVGFWVDKVALGLVFSEFGVLYQFLFHQLHIDHHAGLVH